MNEVYREFFTEVIAAATIHGYTDEPSDAECERLGEPIALLAWKIMNKHYSNSPTPAEKTKGFIELLETALKLAKGEMKL